ncbi:YVTN repeat-like/Quino protein amine dehydrogenase [Leucogyrophana mollusca]|uniref:YVTN repeat-like/Quino protein amine dehydrogenase n=1 Tax=Leucogyrophana mollusca TaxID=85980 RepID=A0ACB8AZQ0_9AGAM|nr:YVTN repeat-like/Quino protein amine dehydrogenase [Leucogyrophana mollusca]
MSTSSNPIESSGVRRESGHPTGIFGGHTGRSRYVGCVAYFPDGRRIASACIDKTVIIWDVERGSQDGQLLQHDFSVDHIAISPDGRKIASGMRQGGVVIWDALTRDVAHKFIGDGVRRLAYSPDGRWIINLPWTNEKEIRLWDVDTARPGREPLKCNRRIWCMAISPDGSRIAVGLSGGSFQVFGVSAGQVVVGPIKGHTLDVTSVAYSPDGRLLVTGSPDKSIRVWDSKTGAQVGNPILGHGGDIRSIAITADARRIATGESGKIRLWDLETRLQVGETFNAGGWPDSVAFSPNGRYIISGGDHLYLFDTEPFTIQRSASIFILLQYRS